MLHGMLPRWGLEGVRVLKGVRHAEKREVAAEWAARAPQQGPAAPLYAHATEGPARAPRAHASFRVVRSRAPPLPGRPATRTLHASCHLAGIPATPGAKALSWTALQPRTGVACAGLALTSPPCPS